jgi:hypothetical protein
MVAYRPHHMPDELCLDAPINSFFGLRKPLLPHPIRDEAAHVAINDAINGD